jgi:DNA ligase-1
MKYGTYTEQRIDGWYASEKYDGMYALWDGGKSIGETLVDSIGRRRISTGLFTSRGNVIHCPQWWADMYLIKGIALEMELWAGYHQFQTVVSVCKRLIPSDEWHSIKPKIFNVPPESLVHYGTKFIYFRDVLTEYKDILTVEFTKINNDNLLKHLSDVILRGGEGLVIRSPDNTWKVNGRSSTCLKLKQVQDSVCKIIGHIDGKGKYVGMLGAYLVKWGDVEFEIGTGIPDSERANPSPIGTVRRFLFRELTNGKIPKEGRMA